MKLKKVISHESSHRPRAVFVANSAWYLYNLRLGVIKSLQEDGWEVVAIAPADEYSQKLRDEKCMVLDVRLNGKGLNPFEDLAFALALWRLYRQFPPDLIFHYTIKPVLYGAWVAYLRRIPSVSVISGLGYTFLKKGILNKFICTAYRLSNRLAGEVWFVNPDDQQVFEKSRLVSLHKSGLLPGEGINVEHFQRTKPLPATQSQGIRFLFSGRLIWTKGVAEFVEAARTIRQKYPWASFHVLGFTNVSNPDAVPAELVHEWHKESIIEYHGHTDDVRPFLEEASCFVLPSYYREGTPRSLLEAASFELPIITTDQVGCREVIMDGHNGFLCRQRSASDLAQKIEQFLLLSEQERLQMGKNGRKMVIDRFDEAKVIAHYRRKTRQVLGTIERESVEHQRPRAAEELFSIKKN